MGRRGDSGEALGAAALTRWALSLCGRCGGAHGTNWNVQTADCDITKGPARRTSPAAGAVANPRLRIPHSPPLHGLLASDSCSGAALRA